MLLPHHECPFNLSRGMTFKCAAAGLPAGGGKAVIIADPAKPKTAEEYRAFGRFVEGLGGLYVTAEDVGTSVSDIDVVRSVTRWALCSSAAAGGSGDSSQSTAYGVLMAMRACLEAAFGDGSFAGKRVASQGVGNVGIALARYLAREGAQLRVSDINGAAAERARTECGAEVVPAEGIFDIACDVFAPCALGGAINTDTVPRLRCRVICGAANNQIADPAAAQAVQARGILYGPDFVANAGGVTQGVDELQGYNADRPWQRVAAIYDNMKRILSIARSENIFTGAAAERLAMRRIEAARAQGRGEGKTAAGGVGCGVSAPRLAVPRLLKQNRSFARCGAAAAARAASRRRGDMTRHCMDRRGIPRRAMALRPPTAIALD